MAPEYSRKKIQHTSLQAVPQKWLAEKAAWCILVLCQGQEQEPLLLFQSEQEQGEHRLKAEAVEDKGREVDSK